MSLNALHHVAIQVRDLNRAIDWYRDNFNCEVTYWDDTWAMLQFENIKLALVIPSQHPAHIALVRENAESFGTLVTHRDGIRSVYIKDSEGNSIEIMDKETVTAS